MHQAHVPSPENEFLYSHAELLIQSYLHWTSHDLIDRSLSMTEAAKWLFHAPFGVVSHNTAPEPIFNYANKTALDLFEMNWETFTRLPSRDSAEPMNREERASLLTRVTQQGFIDDYQGVRISSTGKRFRIEQARVWNVINREGLYCGQAAVFFKWSML